MRFIPGGRPIRSRPTGQIYSIRNSRHSEPAVYPTERNEARPHIWFYYFVAPADPRSRRGAMRRSTLQIPSVYSTVKCVRKLLRSQNRCSRRKALNEQKSVPARRADRLISVKTLASLEFGSHATDSSLLPRICVQRRDPGYIDPWDTYKYSVSSRKILLERIKENAQEREMCSHLFSYKNVSANSAVGSRSRYYSALYRDD